VRVAVVADPDGGGLLQALAEDGAPAGPPQRVGDLAAAARRREQADHPRWVWTATEDVYPRLLREGVPLARCDDLALTEGLLLGYEGRWGEPRSFAAALARLRGLPAPERARPGPRGQAALFEADHAGLPEGDDLLAAGVAVHRQQQLRLAATEHPERMRLLAAAESAAGLAAIEMRAAGMPWRADVHDALLAELLGPRPAAGVPPPRLRRLGERISDAFGGRRVNPDSPAQVARALAADGVSVPSTRSQVLRGVEHPAVPLLLEYKELSRLHSAHGWSWLEAWVRDGRMRADYVPGGVVSGRWATRGGGALQIPRAVRRAVVADPGWALVVADAAQLEPRVLAALSGDQRLARVAGTDGDLYAVLASEAFGGDRAGAKVALFSAIYGGAQGGGRAAELLGVLRRRFPAAIDYVEAAARAGEEGRLVRSLLGRTCPPPRGGPGSSRARPWARDQEEEQGRALAPRSATAPVTTDVEADPEDQGTRRAQRDRGRFTRNFVIQATAADWALVLLAGLRRRLAAQAGAHSGAGAELVFFQHDEVVVHCPRHLADAVVAATGAAAEEAGRLLFGDAPVRFPLNTCVVDCYADAK
jgi:DNA polymerase I